VPPIFKDIFISTEFPDVMSQPDLFELVKTHIVHRPCGPGHYSGCLNNKKECSKGFPKSYQDEMDMTGVTVLTERSLTQRL
jgi:hypothetical protein